MPTVLSRAMLDLRGPGGATSALAAAEAVGLPDERRRGERPSADSRLVILANRLPVHRVRQAGKARWQESPGGLIRALKPVFLERSGVWVGWPGFPGRVPRPFKHGGLEVRPVALSAREVEGYYSGFSNRTVWPLYHHCIRTPEFHPRWWTSYLQVNRRFAETAAAAVRPDDVVWVQDYQLQLVPAMLRALRPELRLGFFLHIPWPPEELFARLPWRRQVLEGLMGADLLGFQTPCDARSFSQAARRYTAAHGGERKLRLGDRQVKVAAFPISIDAARIAELARDPAVVRHSQDLRRRVGPGRRVLLGVDRLDYTKGIDVRLHAYEALLKRKTVTAANCVFLQIAVPTREVVQQYSQLRRHIEQLVGRINGTYGEPGRVAVHLFCRNFPLEELVAFYLAADVMVVTPLRDGMNLVAKEYVASRLDDSGALVLSEFAGAARDLRTAFLVNPYHVEAVAATLEEVLRLAPREGKRRMGLLRRVVQRNDVYQWADDFVSALVDDRPARKA